MEKRDYLVKIKKSQKHLAKQIRKLKHRRKVGNRGDMSLYEIERKAFQLRYEYRHQHIAYCIILGTVRKDIEKPSISNLPNERYIKALIKKYEKAVCSSSD